MSQQAHTPAVWQALCIELLPMLLQDFVRIVGLHATMLLVQNYAGRRLYFPVLATQEHPLAKLIGFDNLKKLSPIYGLENPMIPKAEQALRAVRNAQIRSQYGPKSAATLARDHDLTERQIFTIVGKRVPFNSASNSAQNRLFG